MARAADRAKGPPPCAAWPTLGAPVRPRRPTAASPRAWRPPTRRARVARVKGDQAGRGDHGGGRPPPCWPRRTSRSATGRRAARPAAGRRRPGARRRGRARRARWSRSPRRPRSWPPAGIGGLYAVTTTPAGAARRGPGLAALAGARDRRPGVRAVPPHRHRHRPRPRAAGHRGPARRGRACWSTPTARRSWPRYHPAAELAPRDVVARAIHAERAAGRGAFLDAREAVGDALPRGVPGGVRRLHGRRRRPARCSRSRSRRPCHYHMGGVVTDADGRTSPARPLRRRRMRLDRRARRQPPGLQLPAGGGGVRRTRRPRRRPRGRPAHGAASPPMPAPDLPDDALQTLRQRHEPRRRRGARRRRACRACWPRSTRLEAAHGRAAAAGRRPPGRRVAPWPAAKAAAATSAPTRPASRSAGRRRTFAAVHDLLPAAAWSAAE